MAPFQGSTPKRNSRARKPVRRDMPLMPELQRINDAPPPSGLTFRTSEHGAPCTVGSFGYAFRRWRRAAGLPHRTPHGLRKATASQLGEMGCRNLKIMAVTGCPTMKDSVRYTRGARQRVMAGRASDRPSSVSAEDATAPPGAGTAERDGNAAQATKTKGPEEWPEEWMVPRAGIEPATLRFSVACSTN